MSGPEQLTMRDAGVADVELLCRLNEKLRADERARAPLTWDDLVKRMQGWLGNEGYQAALFELGGAVVAYILFRREPDPCAKDAEMVYVRQFYVEREHRRQGIGVRAMQMWRDAHARDGAPVELDVLERNPGGRTFWQAIGMSSRMTRMRWELS